MHFDSFDDSLDASKATQDKTEVDVAMDLVRNDFYGFNDHESFDDIDTPRMARPKSKKANVKKIDCDIQANVQVCLFYKITFHNINLGMDSDMPSFPLRKECSQSILDTHVASSVW